MNTLNTNVFGITNLKQLSSSYRLYRIRGLSAEQEEYDHNRQILIKKLSYRLRSPVTVIERKEGPYLVLREDAQDPPSPFKLVRTVAYFDNTGEIIKLDFENPTDETVGICQRFLQFALNGGLRDHPSVWQPSAGAPFYYRKPVVQERGVDVYRGGALRVITLENNKLAVCVDIRHKYVSQRPLNPNITPNDFRRIKGSNCVYHFGTQWYDIKIQELSDLNVSEYMIDNGPTQRLSLKQYLLIHSQKPLPREVTNLGDTGKVVMYRTGQDDYKAAPACLCYPTYETNDQRISILHKYTILPPHIRHKEIIEFIKTIKPNLRFGSTEVVLSLQPLHIEKKQFLPPDLSFGNGNILSVRGTKDAIHVNLNELGQARLNALFDKKIGPYTNQPLDKQYFIWPRSVADSYGPVFLKELKEVVNNLYPGEIPYDPTIIVYDDSGSRRYITQGRAILNAINGQSPGWGIVMLHEDENRKHREEDQLASMVMRELRNKRIFVSVIHTTVSNGSYELPANPVKGTSYQRVQDRHQQGKLSGYLRNVALTKVLLTNEKWPFVLSSELNADLTIGIDVKLNTACFTLVGKTGSDLRTVTKDSSQKERLAKDQVKSIFIELLHEEAKQSSGKINSVVVHRDGRLYSSEKKGIEAAFDVLKKEGTVGDNASLHFVAIPKSSPAPIRLFDLSSQANGMTHTYDPEVGSYWVLSSQDAYLCTTGRAFKRRGTANPLHIKYLSGLMPFENILEDIYSLSCLTWTRPEDCTRYPIPMKLADIRLREHAGGYNSDALEYGDEEEISDE